MAPRVNGPIGRLKRISALDGVTAFIKHLLYPLGKAAAQQQRADYGVVVVRLAEEHEEPHRNVSQDEAVVAPRRQHPEAEGLPARIGHAEQHREDEQVEHALAHRPEEVRGEEHEEPRLDARQHGHPRRLEAALPGLAPERVRLVGAEVEKQAEEHHAEEHEHNHTVLVSDPHRSVADEALQRLGERGALGAPEQRVDHGDRSALVEDYAGCRHDGQIFGCAYPCCVCCEFMECRHGR